MDDGPPLLSLIFLLLGAAYFALTETALSSVSKARVRAAADRGDTLAGYAIGVLDNFEKAITTLLIGTNLVHIAFAAVVTVYVTRRWGLNAVTISTAAATLVLFFLGEMLPKTIGKRFSYKLSLACSPLLALFMKLLSPLSSVLTGIGRRAAARHGNETDVSVTEDELQDLIEDMAEEGTLDEDQSDLISSALEFGNITAESILTPRVDICAIDVNQDPEKVLEFVKKQTHSRLPVYEGSIDNIIGVLRTRKYMKVCIKRGNAPKLRPLLDKVYYAHGSTEIHELLPLMSKNRLNMAVITDSYGGTLGIVTVEDILEELVGDIWDESDVVEVPVQKLSEGSWLADAGETLSDVFDTIGFEDPEEEERDSRDEANLLLGEWVYEHFNSIPVRGQAFEYHGLRVSVFKIEHNRILKVKIEFTAESAERAGGPDIRKEKPYAGNRPGHKKIAAGSEAEENKAGGAVPGGTL